MEKSVLREQDQILFFQVIMNPLLGKDKKLCSENTMVDLFRKKIVTSEFLLKIKWAGLQCIVKLFYLVNETQRNCFDLEPEKENNNNSWTYNQPQEDTCVKKLAKRYRIKVLPQNIEGISTLWRMLRTCTSDGDTMLKLLQDTLINVYTNLDPCL